MHICYVKSSAWADLFHFVTSSKHRSISSEVLVFISMQLDIIYIICLAITCYILYLVTGVTVTKILFNYHLADKNSKIFVY